jgi:hypothetical protein
VVGDIPIDGEARIFSDANFINLKINWSSLSEVLIGVVCAYVCSYS